MATNMEKLFNTVKNAAERIHDNGKVDGEQFWSGIKEILSQHDDHVFRWKKTRTKKRDNKIMTTLPEFQTFGDGMCRIIEANHFVIQSVRIPIAENATIRTVAQVALNIGQYDAYDKGQDNMLHNHKALSMYLAKGGNEQMSALVTPEIIREVEMYIDQY